MRTRTSPASTSTSYTRPKSTMFMSSSGSFTCRKVLRTTSAVSTAGAVMDASSPESRVMHAAPVLRANVVDRVAAHQAAPAPRDPAIEPPSQRQCTRQPERRSQPALPRQKPQDLGHRVRPREHAPVGEHRSEEHTSELQSLAYLVC